MDPILVSIARSDTPMAAVHAKLVEADWGPVAWSGFDASAWAEGPRVRAIAAWQRRLSDEYRSTLLFSQFQTLLLLAGVPLDLCGCVGRVVGDEVRHVQLCADVLVALGAPAEADVAATEAYLPVDPAAPMHPQLASLALGLLCLGETVSAGLIGATHAAASSPPIRETLRRLHRDEVYHGELGWHLLEWLLEAGGAEVREGLARTLPEALRRLEALCTDYGPAALAVTWEVTDAELGSLSVEAHRDAFFDAVERLLLPRLDRAGLAGRAAWAARHQPG